MADIFICYRRDDSGAGQAGRLYDRLRLHFGANRVFYDIDNLKFGENFVQKIQQTLQGCAVALVVIGRDWLVRDDSNRLRIKHQSDYVRLEIAAALKARGTKVIPVRVHGGKMPAKRDLPAELAPLLQQHGPELRDTSWDRDVASLIRRLEGIVGKPNTVGSGAKSGGKTAKPGASSAKSKSKPKPKESSAATKRESGSTTKPASKSGASKSGASKSGASKSGGPRGGGTSTATTRDFGSASKRAAKSTGQDRGGAAASKRSTGSTSKRAAKSGGPQSGRGEAPASSKAQKTRQGSSGAGPARGGKSTAQPTKRTGGAGARPGSGTKSGSKAQSAKPKPGTNRPGRKTGGR